RISAIIKHPIRFMNMNEDYVIFVSAFNENVMLKAHYELTEKDTLRLSGFEKIKINESSKTKERKSLLKGIIEGLIQDDKDAAEENWSQFLTKLPISEMVKKKAQAAGKAPGDAGCCNADEEDQEAKGQKRAKQSNNRGKYGSLTTSDEELMNLDPVDDALEEWLDKLPNYGEVKKFVVEAAKKVAEVVCEEKTNSIKIKTKKKEKDEKEKDFEDEDDNDDDVSIDMDDEKEIDELELDLKDKKNDKKKTSEKAKKHESKVKKYREKFAKKEKDDEFSESIVKIKRSNNAQDEESLIEALTDVVSSNPSIIYVSKNELSGLIERVLESKEEKNWDKELCENIASGLKKLAQNTYAEQAYDIIKYAAIDEAVDMEEEVPDDDFEAFEVVSEKYFTNIYERAEKQYKALMHLAEMLMKSASVLEKEAKSYGLEENAINKTVAELREYASTVTSEAYGPMNQATVRMVVGSLLTRHADDYSLNAPSKLEDPGHFHKSVDMDDDDDYNRHTEKANKTAMKGDEELSIGNPSTPKSKDANSLDLIDDKDIKGFETMQKGIHTNPLAPKQMSQKDVHVEK
ncbi:MAG: hypothetical protein ACOCUT_01125, partial [bacterium]